MNRVRMMFRLCLLLIAGCLLSACVTTSEGGIPDPAPAPQRVDAHLDLARGYLEQGDLERARVPVNKALKIDPRSAEAHVLLAVINQNEQEYALAEKEYKAALASEPRNAMALNNYGSFLYSRGRYQEAVKYLRLLATDVNYRQRAQAYENLGLAEMKVGDNVAASHAFNRSVQLSLAQPRSSLELADLAYSEGEYNRAQEYYDAYRNQARQTARTLCLGMKLAYIKGDNDQMASFALALKNLFPDSKETKDCEVSN